MSALVERCICCGREQPAEQFTGAARVCATCLALDVCTAILQARATAEVEAHIMADSRKLKRERHLERKRAQYAEHGKRCTSCHGYKPVEAYGNCAPRADGLAVECRSCINARNALVRNDAAAGKATWITVRDTLRALNAAKHAAAVA